jgi:hypothetical protein
VWSQAAQDQGLAEEAGKLSDWAWDSNVPGPLLFEGEGLVMEKKKYAVYYSVSVVVEADDQDSAGDLADKKLDNMKPAEVVSALEYSDTTEVE